MCPMGQVVLPSKVAVEGEILGLSDTGNTILSLEKDGGISFTDGDVVIPITEDDVAVSLSSGPI